jgi:AcrR family transcriptional regulator
MNIMTRSYQLRQRAESQDRTRQKIVKAAIELHQTKGPAATSMNDIAERAKVGKVTVYRHFPDDAAMINACSGLYFQRHPFPDPETWRSIQDATEMLRQGLSEIYTYHQSTEAMMNHVMAEMRNDPLMAPYHDHWRRAVDILTAAWPVTGHRRKKLKAAIALALSFETWRSLVQENGLTESQAVELMLRLTCGCPSA